MLQTKAIEPITLSILNDLMQLDALKNFYLVGGTAMAMQYGHRLSIDLDLFCNEPLVHETILVELQNKFGAEFYFAGKHLKVGIFCQISGVKVDIVYYPHPIIAPIIIEENIRMFGIYDLAAMKVQAILGRGSKKDFFDLEEILKHLTLKDIIQAHTQKFPSQQLLISIPYAITYFDDAEESETPVSLNGSTWEGTKKTLQKHVRAFLS